MIRRIIRWWRYREYRKTDMGLIAWDGHEWTVFSIRLVGCEYPVIQDGNLVFAPLFEIDNEEERES